MDIWIIEAEWKSDMRIVEDAWVAFYKKELKQFRRRVEIKPKGKILSIKQHHIRGLSEDLFNRVFNYLVNIIHEAELEENESGLKEYQRVGQYMFRLDDERSKK